MSALSFISPLKNYLIAAAVVVAFFVGWTVNGWRHDAAQAKSLRKDIADTVAMFDQAGNDLNAKVVAIDKLNRETSDSERATIEAIGGVRAELKRVRYEISKVDVGSARFSGDADRVRAAAYQAAVAGTQDNPPGAPIGGDGKSRPSSSANAAVRDGSAGAGESDSQ